MGVDTHVTSSSGQRLSLSIRNVLLRLRVSVLLGHTEIDDVDYIGSFGARAPDEEVVGLDVTVDEVLFVYCLNTSDLYQPPFSATAHTYAGQMCARTICRAAMHTVFIENFLPHISNRSSRLGPSRSMTRILWRPS